MCSRWTYFKLKMDSRANTEEEKEKEGETLQGKEPENQTVNALVREQEDPARETGKLWFV